MLNKDNVKLIKWTTKIDGINAIRMIYLYDGNVIASSILSGADKVDPVIFDLYTHERYRMKGFCFDMVKHWENVIKKRKGFDKNQVYLTVSNDNSMVKTYLKWGFEFTGGRTDNGDVWMLKKL